jgi:uncharacterized membrane protein (UPF0127 family)
MKRVIRTVLAVAGLALAAPIAAAEPAIHWIKPGPTVPLGIVSGTIRHRFQVERALTPAMQEQGLMFRRTMPRDHGMIFPMERPQGASFWMKNTYISLDIIFIGADHRILQIAPRATPLSEATIDCPQPVVAVLELNGGIAEQSGIKVGDKVEW